MQKPPVTYLKLIQYLKIKLTVSINSIIFENQKSHATLTIYEWQDPS